MWIPSRVQANSTNVHLKTVKSYSVITERENGTDVCLFLTEAINIGRRSDLARHLRIHTNER